MKVIDREQFDENFQYYDRNTIRAVIENFTEEAEERLNDMERNITGHNFEKLAFNAHSFKSVIGNFMAPQPFEVCKNLEDMAKRKIETNIMNVFSELKTLTSALQTELMEYQDKSPN